MSMDDDDATLRTCGLRDTYTSNKEALDEIAHIAYESLCDTARQVTQAANANTVKAPTLDECEDFYGKLLPKLPVYKKIKITPFLNSSWHQPCCEALARYIVESNWTDIVTLHPCI